MFNLERWIEIYQSIKKNKLRAILSGFTVSLGILLFIILFGLGEGLKNSYEDLFLNGDLYPTGNFAILLYFIYL